MKDISLSAKLAICFLIVGLVRFTVSSVIYLVKSTNGLSNGAYDHTEGMRAAK